MAQPSPPSTSSSSSIYGWTHDVFLNFRGEDTREGFTGNLYYALRQRGIRAFLDDEGLGRGEDITQALLKAIEESQIAITIFSETYASSTFCLEELVKILECVKGKGRSVLPVFYRVNPSDVRHQRGSYGEALAKHQNKQKVEAWSLALHKAANLSGWHFKGYEYEYVFIGKIVEEVSKKLKHSPTNIANPVGPEARVQEEKKLLAVERNDEKLRMDGASDAGINTFISGPWGGNGGSSWDDGISTGIRGVTLRYDDCIYSIHVVYDRNGQRFQAEKHGQGGTKSAVIKLDYPNEFLVEVSGHYSSYICSLTFKSNLRLFGPYGVEEGTQFVYSSFPNQEIVGFYGRSDLYLDSLGLHLSRAIKKERASDGMLNNIVGPWGGKRGNNWDDGIFTGVRKITIQYDDRLIYSILVVYDKHGQPLQAKKNGGWGPNGGKHKAEINLDYPDEFLIEISGHYKYSVQSLTFKSNRRTFGPYGLEEEMDFKYSLRPNETIVGFLGRCGWYLDTIGFHLSHSIGKNLALPLQVTDFGMENTFKLGPWGGNDGSRWDDGTFTGIRGVTLRYDDCIYSIRVVYDMNGQPCQAEKHGHGGTKCAVIKLEYPNEFLVEVSGHYRSCIHSLTFKSNLRLFGPYGVEEGTQFACSSFPNQEIVGFYGASDLYLDSFGLHLSHAIQKERAHNGVLNTIVGPWGGRSGNNWDDGVFTGVRKITLQYDDRLIYSILVVYDKHGQPLQAEKNGGWGPNGGKHKAEIKLEYPDEFLIEISGHYKDSVQSLTFKSNRRTFGPYGLEEGTDFKYSLHPNEKIVGFLGRCGWYLDTIGFHLSHTIEKNLALPLQAADFGMKNTFKLGPWGGNGGSSWDDGIFTGIRGVSLRYDICVYSINAVYDMNGQPFQAEKHGHGGTKSAVIKLDYPNEFLVEVSGHYSSYICSLTFKSNLRLFGPYGAEKGTQFIYSAFPSQEIVGFYGASDLYVDSLGLHLSHAINEERARNGVLNTIVGPWGGRRGNNWDDGIFTGVRKITLQYEDRLIYSILVVYDKHGQPFQAEKNGGWGPNGGKHKAEINLEYPDEFLIEISGHYKDSVQSLTFKSNRRTFGPYGLEEGTDFKYSLQPNEKIVGFLGRCGWYLDTIGFHLSHKIEKNLALPLSALPDIMVLAPPLRAAESMMKNTFKSGPWGGNGGSIWDDGTFIGIRGVTLRYDDCIYSIQVVYDTNGQPFQAEKHGHGGTKSVVIKLDYPNEFLVEVSGHYSSYISSLTFKSNIRLFGPYGAEKGTQFAYSAFPNQEVVGFYGASDLNLDSLGLHLSHAINEERARNGILNTIVGPWGGKRGNNWDDGIFTGVRKITLQYDDRLIYSILVVYDKLGQPLKAEKNGGWGPKATYTAEINLEYPDEFLIEISGHYNDSVQSLTFKSNRRTFGPYGLEEGTDFKYSLCPNEKIVGFLGRCGWYLDTIGFHLSHAIEEEQEY